MLSHLVLRFAAPLIAFGGETIDNYGVIRQFPAKSMVVGLIANALGIERNERRKLQEIQDCLLLGSRVDRQGVMVRDFQFVALSMKDKGWTTRGVIEGRAGRNEVSGPYLRFRDYWSDALVRVALRFSKASFLDLDVLQEALHKPARPLFLGRKPCVPSEPIFAGRIDAPSLCNALLKLPEENGQDPRVFLQWPLSEERLAEDLDLGEGNKLEPICDERSWISGVHCGQRLVRIFEIGPKSMKGLT
jgi:CRISPR system Cascade subunit CasD